MQIDKRQNDINSLQQLSEAQGKNLGVMQQQNKNLQDSLTKLDEQYANLQQQVEYQSK